MAKRQKLTARQVAGLIVEGARQRGVSPVLAARNEAGKSRAPSPALEVRREVVRSLRVSLPYSRVARLVHKWGWAGSDATDIIETVKRDMARSIDREFVAAAIKAGEA